MQPLKFRQSLRKYVNNCHKNDVDVDLCNLFEKEGILDPTAGSQLFRQSIHEIISQKPNDYAQKWAKIVKSDNFIILDRQDIRKYWVNAALDTANDTQMRQYAGHVTRHLATMPSSSNTHLLAAKRKAGQLDEIPPVVKESEKKSRPIPDEDAEIFAEILSYNNGDDDEDGNDEHIPSDLTADYHPGRRNEYYFDYDDANNNDDDSGDDDDVNTHRTLHDEDSDSTAAINENTLEVDTVSRATSWLTADGETDLANLCYQFKASTLKISNPAQQQSDLRILSRHDIYVFDAINQSFSVSKDWDPDLHKRAIASLSINLPPKPMHAAQWCTDISLGSYDDWTTALGIAATYLAQACTPPEGTVQNMVDIHSMQTMMVMLPSLITNPSECRIEDTYVHNYIAPILKPVFACEPLLRVDWANSQLREGRQRKGKDKEDKPDFLGKVKASRNLWIAVVVGEFKPPGFSSTLESDLVKIGREMRNMVNELVCLGVTSPTVGGILIQGRLIMTFQFDLAAPKLYRMVKLSETAMFETLDQVASLPSIVARILQIKNITMITARKVQDLVYQRNTSMRRIPESPQDSWRSNHTVMLRRNTPK